MSITALCAIVRCGPLAVAIPADTITFISGADEAAISTRDKGATIKIGAFEAPAWRLHELLEIEANVSSWLFLRGTGVKGAALGCGECLTIARLAAPEPLPRGIFRARADAILGAFRVDDALVERGCGPLGLWVEPARLIPAEPA
jgi:hypothetical protein